MPRKSLMHHNIQKIISYHNFYLFFPICKWKEFKLFQLLESLKKNVLMHHSSIKKSLNNLTLLFSLFLVWGELMLMIGRLPTFGIYVQMFTTVAKNFAKFLAAYFCLLVAFALCFCVLYPNYQSFNVPFPAAVVKTLGCFLSKFSNV